LFWPVLRQTDKLEAAMKTFPPLLFAAALGMALLAAPAAQAFTFENQASGDSAVNALAPGVKPYVDPTDKLEPAQGASRFDGNGATTYQQKGLTLQFGQPRSFNERYNPDYLYDPLRR
jgi:ABC-type transport system substrate-binding protein